MLLAAQARGWELHYLEQSDLYLRDGKARARTRNLEVQDVPQGWSRLDKEQDLSLAALDVILMRKDPPFDMEYVYSTYLLERAEQAGVLVVNYPQALRDANEKAYTAVFLMLSTHPHNPELDRLAAISGRARQNRGEASGRHGWCFGVCVDARGSQHFRGAGNPDTARQPPYHGAEIHPGNHRGRQTHPVD